VIVPKGEESMERVKVESTNLNSVGYNKDEKILEIQFNYRSAVYQYYRVPEYIHTGLMRATSKGDYFHRRIKGKYKFKKVE